jgi:hypothetical protein
MVTAILIVGDDAPLLATRAHLLSEWRVSTSTSRQAFQLIQPAYDLLIICQTISDTTAGQLIDKAREMNPHIQALVISQPGQERDLTAHLFEVQLTDPDRLRRVVTHLLQQTDSRKTRLYRPRLAVI